MTTGTRYRKRPIEVEAVRFVAGKPGAVLDFASTDFASPVKDRNRVVWFRIKTLEGWTFLNPGEWLIRGIKGEFYPIKPDIFAETYEKMEA